MAKEIIDNTERFILVQIDKEGTERVVYQDFTGSFTTSEMKWLTMLKILNLKKTLRKLRRR